MRASHVLIKHQESRNPVSRRTDRSTSQVTRKMAEAELRRWRHELTKDDGRPMHEKFAALAHHRSDCGSFECGGDLGVFGRGEVSNAVPRARHPALPDAPMPCALTPSRSDRHRCKSRLRRRRMRLPSAR